MADLVHLEQLMQGVKRWNNWRKSNPAVRPDLIGVNLSHINLKEANLSGANLDFANLSRADLRGANLSRATLNETSLIDTNLSGANLSSATLNFSNLDGTNLSGANLSGANLIGVDLIDANLSGANLLNANLSGANLTDVNLSGTNLIGTHLIEANLTQPQAWLNQILSIGTHLEDWNIHRTTKVTENETPQEDFSSTPFSDDWAETIKNENTGNVNSGPTFNKNDIGNRSININNQTFHGPVGNAAGTNIGKQQTVQHNYAATETPTLTEAAAEIQDLLKQLASSNPTATKADQIAFLNVMIPTTKREWFIRAWKAASSLAIEEIPYGSVLKTLVEEWQNPRQGQ